MPANTWFAFIVIAVVALAVARRLAPLVASIFGLTFAVAVGVWGYVTFARGGGFALLGTLPVNRTMFFGFVVFWFGLEMHGLVRVLRHRASQQKMAEQLEQERLAGSGEG